MALAIEQAIRANAGLIAGEMMEGEPEDDSDAMPDEVTG